DLPAAAVFVAPATASPSIDIGTIARIYGLTPAEARLLQQLIVGASLTEAASALGIAEATADAPQPHLRQDRRVAPGGSAHADYQTSASHPPSAFILSACAFGERFHPTI